MSNKEEKITLLKNKYSVPAVVNAFEILKVLSRKKYKESTLTEIANAVGLTPATCYRLLHQMKQLSLVRFDNRKKRYTLGTYLVVLGERAKENLDFIRLIEPYLSELTKQTGLTSLLVSRVDEHRLTQIAKNEGDNFRIGISVGRHFNILDSESYGRCFLAFMESEERDELIMHNPEKDKLVKELKNYQEHGFSWSYSQDENSKFPGIFGVSSPVFLEEEKMELCISVVGMTAQFTEKEVIQTVAPHVKMIATQINEILNDEI